MSSTIDERVVTLKFNNGQFEIGVKKTLDSLSALKNGLNLNAAAKSLNELDEAGKKFSMGNMGATIEGVNGKFLAMATIAITALSNITTKAIQTGTQLVKSLTIDPMKSGLEEYETNLNAIQTILANTQSKGTNLDQVNAALQELNTYSDQTIYNFSEMARNIGTFTAAGVDLDKSTQAIKGIANLAAVSGSNSQQASTAMYQLSQALAAGKVSLMDWNSVVNAGMGGQVFQDALKETARAHGVAVDEIIEKQGSFRDSLQEGWIDSSILTETLSKFTGDLNAEQLKSMGYTDQQIADIMKLGETAKDAATKVKTFTQLQDTLKESVQSGWGQTFQIIFGNFDEAKELWTGVNNVLGDMISKSANARNTMLQTWKDLGGRTSAIQAVKNVFNALMPILDEVKQAFTEFFPPLTGERLFAITKAIEEFTAKLKPSEDTIDKIARAFSGLFAILQIAGNLIKAVVGMFVDLAGEASGSGSALLDFAARIGDWLVALNRAIIDGKVFTNFFGDMGSVLKTVIRTIKEVASWFKTLFSSGAEAANDNLSGAIGRISDRLKPLSALGNAIVAVWERMGSVFGRVWEIFRPLVEKMSEFFGELGKNIADSIQNMDFSQVLDTVNTGLFAGLVLIMKKFLSGGVNVDLGGGFLGTIKDSFEGLTGVLNAMQTQLKAGALIKIAGAVALLTASVVALSLIDSGKLTAALSAMTIMFLQLAGAMAVLEKIGTFGSTLKLGVMATAMIGLSTAILILAAAVRVLSGLNWGELAKGVGAVTVLLGALALSVKLMQSSAGGPAGMVAAGVGMMAMATAINILASAVKSFAELQLADLGKGMAAVAVSMGIMVGAVLLMSGNTAGTLAASAAMVGMAISMKILASAVKDFAEMSWGEIGRGLAAMAGGLLLLVAALIVIPPTAIIGAASLAVAAVSLVIFAKAMQSFGDMSWGEIGKAMTVLTGGLLILAAALTVMLVALPGAIALGVATLALAGLVPVIITLGGLEWSTIGQALGMMAAILGTLALAGIALIPALPGLLGLAAAVALIGVGVLAAGVGLVAFSAGLTALSVALAVSGVAIVAFVGALIGLIPSAIAAIADGIVQFSIIIGNSGPVFVTAMTALLLSLITAIDNVAPAIISTLVNLIMKLVDAITTLLPYFSDKGSEMITKMLEGLARNVPKMASAATDVITAFIRAIGDNSLRIVNQAADTLIVFLNGIADAIRSHSGELQAAGQNIASAILDGMTGGLARGVGKVAEAARNVAKSALDAAKNFLGIHSPSKAFYEVGEWSNAGFAKALIQTSGVVTEASRGVGKAAISTLKDTMSSASSAISADMDLSPTIRPVLDLTEVRRGKDQIDGMMQSSTITPVASFRKAATIAADQRMTRQEMFEAQYHGESAKAPIQFTQNNYSPVALTPVEIYRTTKNQLSVARKGGIN